MSIYTLVHSVNLEWKASHELNTGCSSDSKNLRTPLKGDKKGTVEYGIVHVPPNLLFAQPAFLNYFMNSPSLPWI